MPQATILPNSQQRSIPYLLWSALIRKQPICDRLCIQTTPTVAAHERVRVRPLVVSTNHDAQLWRARQGEEGRELEVLRDSSGFSGAPKREKKTTRTHSALPRKFKKSFPCYADEFTKVKGVKHRNIGL